MVTSPCFKGVSLKMVHLLSDVFLRVGGLRCIVPLFGLYKNLKTMTFKTLKVRQTLTFFEREYAKYK